eukprot:Amastigsp_a347221_11.p5 type:complete len:117 gc:universal Amastigsp_a347221_11:502-152(-)
MALHVPAQCDVPLLVRQVRSIGCDSREQVSHRLSPRHHSPGAPCFVLHVLRRVAASLGGPLVVLLLGRNDLRLHPQLDAPQLPFREREERRGEIQHDWRQELAGQLCGQGLGQRGL